jgi:hypothetical protein
MKKVILFLTLYFFINNVSASCIKSDTVNTKKKFALNLGFSYKNGLNNFGGNLKFDYIASNKLSVGIKTNATNNKQNYFITDYISVKDVSGLYLLTDLTLTYHVFENPYRNKKDFYVEIGLGYQLEKENSIHKFNNYPAFERNYLSKGFGGHTSIGGSYKIGKGNIYTEFIAGAIFWGTYQDIAVYPTNYPGVSTGNPKPNSGANQEGKGSIFNNSLFSNDGILGINAGYSFCF